MATIWRCSHEDLGEPVHVDGSPILRPVVPIVVAVGMPAVLGVVDSGSPISVATADLFERLDIDIDSDQPAFEVPLSVGGGFERTPVFTVEIYLRAPDPSNRELVRHVSDPHRRDLVHRRGAGSSHEVTGAAAGRACSARRFVLVSIRCQGRPTQGTNRGTNGD